MIELTRTGKTPLVIENPVMPAAGTFGFDGAAYRDLLDLTKLGAIVTNPVTWRPRRVAGGTRVVPLPAGVLVHTGLPNPGMRRTIARYRASWAHSLAPVIVHVVATSPAEVARCAAALAGATARIAELTAFVGLDGFVDEILHVVDKRQSATAYDRMLTITQLAERLAGAASIAAGTFHGGSAHFSTRKSIIAPTLSGRPSRPMNHCCNCSTPASSPASSRVVDASAAVVIPERVKVISPPSPTAWIRGRNRSVCRWSARPASAQCASASSSSAVGPQAQVCRVRQSGTTESSSVTGSTPAALVKRVISRIRPASASARSSVRNSISSGVGAEWTTTTSRGSGESAFHFLRIHIAVGAQTVGIEQRRRAVDRVLLGEGVGGGQPLLRLGGAHVGHRLGRVEAGDAVADLRQELVGHVARVLLALVAEEQLGGVGFDREVILYGLVFGAAKGRVSQHHIEALGGRGLHRFFQRVAPANFGGGDPVQRQVHHPQ